MARSSRMLRSSSATRMRASGMVTWQAEREDGADPAGGADVHRPPVVLDDPVHEGEPQAASTRLGGEERLEDVLQILGGDAAARVRDLETEPLVCRARRDAQL